MQRPATGLTGCANSQVQGNRVAPSPQDQKWCFQGPEDVYEIKLSNGQSYLWPSSSGREIGFYNIKDFRPMRRVEGPTPKFTYTDPPDYTKAIRNAMMVMASRQGGTLVFPDGDYIVGTTDGNTRDQSFEGITVPSGVTIMGSKRQLLGPDNQLTGPQQRRAHPSYATTSRPYSASAAVRILLRFETSSCSETPIFTASRSAIPSAPTASRLPVNGRSTLRQK